VRNFAVVDADLGTKAVYLATPIGIFWMCYHQRNPPFHSFAHFFYYSLARSLFSAYFGRFEEYNFRPITSNNKVKYDSQEVICYLVLLIIPIIY
jgi:hypothetical protein